MNKNEKKIALITGSASKIGSKIAVFLANAGWKIVLHYNSSENKALELATTINKITDSYLIKCDFTDATALANFIPKINKDFGTVEILINNASYFVKDQSITMEAEHTSKHFMINFVAPLMLAEQLIAQQNLINGNLINILDAADLAHEKFFTYYLSKKALLQAMPIFAKKLAPKIRANGIALGIVLKHEQQSLAHFEKLCQTSILGYSGTIEDVCYTIEFILNSSAITGQVIFLDGGLNLGTK